MRLFLDTEYTGSHFSDPQLISLALVAEDGCLEWYAELADGWAEQDCSQFVIREVLPHLQGSRLTWVEARESLQQWFAAAPRSCVVACDAERDLQFLLALLGERPTNLDPQRLDLAPLIDTSTYHRAVEKYHARPDHPWHHALHDTRSYRLAWLTAQAEIQKQSR